MLCCSETDARSKRENIKAKKTRVITLPEGLPLYDNSDIFGRPYTLISIILSTLSEPIVGPFECEATNGILQVISYRNIK